MALEIPIEKTEGLNDIYDYGFNEYLYRIPADLVTNPLVQDPVEDAVNPLVISSGGLSGVLTLVDGYLQSSNFVANTSGWRLTPTSGELNFAVSVDSLDIPDTTTANSFHVDNTGNTWWGSTTLGGAVAKVSNTGVATFTKVTISGGSSVIFISDTLDTSAKTILGDFTFGASGAIKMITDADNGLWISPTGILGKKAGVNTFAIDTSGAITSFSLTTGNITLDSAGYIRGGQTAYNTGIGFFLGYSGAAYKFSVGNPAADYMTHDGSVLTVNASKIVKNFTAGITINSGEAVFVYSDGKIYSTDASDSIDNWVIKFIGIAVENISSGSSGKIQTFGNITGLSGLSSGSFYYLLNATHTLDQTCATSGGWTNIAYSSEINYQSFTTGGSITQISKVEVYLNCETTQPAQNIICRLRVGTGTGGTLLATKIVSKSWSAGENAAVTFIFPVPITVSSSTVYSITLQGGGSLYYVRWLYDSTNPYAGGRSDISATGDYYLKTYYSSSRGGLSTSAGTYSKKVGIAVSSTELTLKDAI